MATMLEEKPTPNTIVASNILSLTFFHGVIMLSRTQIKNTRGMVTIV